MKILWQSNLLEIGSAGLRCGRYILLHQKDKGKEKRAVYDYYRGKWYSYLWVLHFVGLVEFLSPDVIYDYGGYLHTFRKGKIRLFPDLHFTPEMLMDKKFFNQILNSDQQHQGKVVTRDLRRMCREIQ